MDEIGNQGPERASGSESALGLNGLDLKLPVFEGPLDLLLHLVREHRLDIFDIPIAFITERYLEMVNRMQELNLDIAGEYLLMAATLAHIKSRMLLPRPEPEEEDEDESLDPREDLVRRLLEYQKYKEAGESLAKADLLGREVFSRNVRTLAMPREEGDLGLREVSVFKLVEALDQVFARAEPELAHEVLLDRVSVSQRISEIVEVLRGQRTVGFLTLFDRATSRHLIIATFLALLEVARLGLATIRQQEDGGEILVAAAAGLDAGREAPPVLDGLQDDFR